MPFSPSLSRPLRVVLCCLAGLCLVLPASAAPKAGATSTHTNASRDYSLRTHNGRVSLDATDASLTRIVKDIGRRMDIAVEARLPKDERVTAKFDDLPLAEALGRLSANHMLVADKKTGAISRIVLVPHGQTDSAPKADRQLAEEPPTDQAPAKPFEFEFDPSQVPEESGKEN